MPSEADRLWRRTGGRSRQGSLRKAGECETRGVVRSSSEYECKAGQVASIDSSTDVAVPGRLCEIGSARLQARFNYGTQSATRTLGLISNSPTLKDSPRRVVVAPVFKASLKASKTAVSRLDRISLRRLMLAVPAVSSTNGEVRPINS